MQGQILPVPPPSQAPLIKVTSQIYPTSPVGGRERAWPCGSRLRPMEPCRCRADTAAGRSSQQRARTDVPTKRSWRRKTMLGSEPPSISVVPLVPGSSSPCPRSQGISLVAPRPSVPLRHASLCALGTLPNLSAPWKWLGIIYNNRKRMSNYFRENGELNNRQHGSHEIDLVPD